MENRDVRSKRGKNNRRKGHSFERDTAREFRKVFPDAQRHLEYQQGHCYGVDLEGTGNLRVQCKRGARYCNPNKIEEVKTTPRSIPVLVTKADRKRSIACLYLEDLIKILGDIGEVYD